MQWLTSVVWEMVVVLFTLVGVVGLFGVSLAAAVCPRVFSSCSPSRRAAPSYEERGREGGMRDERKGGRGGVTGAVEWCLLQ